MAAGYHNQVGADGKAFKTASGDGTSSDPYVKSVALEAAENHIGSVGSGLVVLDLTLTLDTNIYADGDLMVDATALTTAVRVAAGTSRLVSVVVLDEDDQGVAFDLLFLNAATSLGSLNAAVNLTDAMGRTLIGKVAVATGDYYDFGGCRAAFKSDLNMLLKAASASTTLYVAAVSRGAGTYTAAGIRIKVGLVQD
jgi:hypothetical protein